MLLVLALVAVWPLGRTIWFSFTDANINDIDASQFVGLENYFGSSACSPTPTTRTASGMATGACRFSTR